MSSPKQKRVMESTNDTDVYLHFPDDVWKQILRFISKESWPSVLIASKKFYNLALPIFLEIVQEIAKKSAHEKSNEEKSIKKLYALRNLNRIVEAGIPDTVVVTEDTINSVPWIEADGVTITFPLVESAVKPLLAKAEIAPFGKGSSTLIDSNIRSGWQILGSKIKIHSGEWDDEILSDSDILNSIQNALLPKRDVSIRAELDKLLIYGPGDHFKPHKDTIRGKNHFGSLVIFLPSIYEGGELVVRHRDFEGSYQCHCVSFFTDCEHEVLPVTSGYRVTLTYHLYYEEEEEEEESEPKEARPTLHKEFSWKIYQALFTSYLEHQREKDSDIFQLGIVLEHSYSEETLSPEQLKGRDLAIYKILSPLSLKLSTINIEIEGPTTGNERETATIDVNSPKKIGSTIDKEEWKNVSISSSDYAADYNYHPEDEEESGNCRFIQDLDDIKFHHSYKMGEYTLGNVGAEAEYYNYKTAALFVSLKDYTKKKEDAKNDDDDE